MRFPATFIDLQLFDRGSPGQRSFIWAHPLSPRVWFLAEYWAFAVSIKLRIVPARFIKKQPVMCVRLGYTYPLSENDPRPTAGMPRPLSVYRYMNYQKEFIILDSYPL